MKYLDFDLVIEPLGDGFSARVFNSPGGQASADFTAPFSDLEIENFLLRVGRTRHAVRRIESPEMTSAKIFGGRLFDKVFAGDVRGCLRSSMDEANRQGVGLRVRLHLGKAPTLADLPWEFLYNASMNRFLGLSVETPVVRYLELPERIRPLTVAPPLRVLMMISSPTDFPQLDVKRESAKMDEALSDLEQRGLVKVERQENATLAELQRRLRQGQYHIFHFIGHGGFDEQQQDGVLILEDPEERGRRVSAQFIGTLLHDHRPLRLAVLNACEGARASRADPFAGTAQSLVQQGIPAVIAMQFEVTDEAAICFTREFYAAIATGYPVDAALAEARKAIFAEVSEIEWGTPVLYMRAPDGLIFEMEQVSESDRRLLQVTTLMTAARTALSADDEATAIDKLKQVLALDAGHADAAALLRDIARRKEVAELYDTARAKIDAGQFADALVPLHRLQSIERGYRDVDALVAMASKAIAQKADADARLRGLEALRRDAAASMTEESWDEAVEQWQKVVASAPDDHDARAQLSEARRQQELARLYARGLSHYELRHWREALAEFHQVHRIRNPYKDVADLVSRIERELRRDDEKQASHAAPPPPAQHAGPAKVVVRSGDGQQKPPVIIKPPAAKPARAGWFVMGGVMGAAVVVGLIVVALIVIGVIYDNLETSNPSQPTLADLGSSLAPTPTPQPAPPPPTPASAPRKSTPTVPVASLDPNEMIPAPPAIEAQLKQFVLSADNLEIQAYQTMNPTLLQSAYTGSVLAKHVQEMTALATAGVFAVNRLAGSRFGPITVSRDGQRAVVEVTETWASDFHPIAAPQQCSFHIHERPIPQTIRMQRAGQGWIVYDLTQPEENLQPVPCH
jgi:tetratricopeptide (TPR) repeat protein